MHFGDTLFSIERMIGCCEAKRLVENMKSFYAANLHYVRPLNDGNRHTMQMNNLPDVDYN